MMTTFGLPDALWSDQEAREHARRARAILEDPVFERAVKGAAENIVQEWVAAETVAAREEAWATVRALDAVQRSLHRIIADAEHLSN
jgi:hypothetical protein